MGRALWEGRHCDGTRGTGTLRAARQDKGTSHWGTYRMGGGTRPIVQIPHVTCTNQPPLWKPPQGTEGGGVLSLVCTPPSEVFRAPQGSGRAEEQKGQGSRTALTVPSAGQHQPQTSALGARREWLFRCLLGLWWGRGRGHSPQDSLFVIWISRGIPAHSSASIVVSMTLRGG